MRLRPKHKILVIFVFSLFIILGCQDVETSSEKDAYFYLQTMEETDIAVVKARRATITSTYLLLEIHEEQKKQTDILEEILLQLEGGGE